MRDPRLKPTYLLTVKLISLQISCWSPEKMPISPLVVRDVSLHLVLNNLIWQEYPFNPSNLQPRDMESSSTKTTIKGAGGRRKNNCKLFRLKSSWRSGSDRKRSVLPSDCFLFIFWQGALDSKRHMQPRDVSIYVHVQIHTWNQPDFSIFQGIIVGVKVCEGQRRVSLTNADGCVNPGLSDLRAHMRIIWNDTNM